MNETAFFYWWVCSVLFLGGLLVVVFFAAIFALGEKEKFLGFHVPSVGIENKTTVSLGLGMPNWYIWGVIVLLSLIGMPIIAPYVSGAADPDPLGLMLFGFITYQCFHFIKKLSRNPDKIN